jgi:hypothetical protein
VDFRKNRTGRDDFGLLDGLDSSLLFGDLGINIGVRGKGRKRVELHSSGNVGLYGLGSSGDFESLGSALSSKTGIFLGQPHAVITNDDAIKIALVVDVDHVTGMDVLGDKHAVEYSSGMGGSPCGAIEAGKPSVK